MGVLPDLIKIEQSAFYLHQHILRHENQAQHKPQLLDHMTHMKQLQIHKFKKDVAAVVSRRAYMQTDEELLLERKILVLLDICYSQLTSLQHSSHNKILVFTTKNMVFSCDVCDLYACILQCKRGTKQNGPLFSYSDFRPAGLLNVTVVSAGY